MSGDNGAATQLHVPFVVLNPRLSGRQKHKVKYVTRFKIIYDQDSEISLDECLNWKNKV